MHKYKSFHGKEVNTLSGEADQFIVENKNHIAMRRK